MRPPEASSATQWTARDAVAWAVAGVSCAFCVLAGWYGASGTPRTSTQYLWTNVAAAGVIVLGAGNLLWLLAGRRRLGIYRQDLLSRLPDPLPVVAMSLAAAGTAFEGGAPAAIPAGRYYHRSSCRLIAGKATTTASVLEHETARRSPCGVCEP